MTAQDKNQTTTQDKNECYECGYAAASLHLRNNTGPQDCCEEQERPPQTLICDGCAEEAGLCWCAECGKVQENDDDVFDLCEECDKVKTMCSGDGHKCEYYVKDEMWQAGNCYYCSRECVQEYLDECLAEGKQPKPVHRPKIGDEDEDDEDDGDCDDFRRFLAIIHPADE
jgi:hypothetical protein